MKSAEQAKELIERNDDGRDDPDGNLNNLGSYGGFIDDQQGLYDDTPEGLPLGGER